MDRKGQQRRRIGLGLVAVAVAVAFEQNPAAALESCARVASSGTDRSGDPCSREVRIAYLAGAYKSGEPVIAALTDRTAEVVIEGLKPIRVRVGQVNNSGIALDDSLIRRSLMIGPDGLLLNYIAVSVGQRETVTVGIHRLNTDGSRRTDEASNPPHQIVDTCVIVGGPDMSTEAGLRTIQIIAQNSRLGKEPGDYRNSNNDLVFQDPNRLFQGVDLTYLLKK